MDGLPGTTSPPLEPGTGGCGEAQADGVPCSCLGVSCEICNRRLSFTAAPAPLRYSDPVPTHRGPYA